MGKKVKMLAAAAPVANVPNTGYLISSMEGLAEAANNRLMYSNTNFGSTGGISAAINLADYMGNVSVTENPYTAMDGTVLGAHELYTDYIATPSIGDELNSNVQQEASTQLRWAKQSKLSADGSKVEVYDKVDQYTNDQLDSYADTKSTLVGSIAGKLVAGVTMVNLGKTISSALYNLNPELWDSFGWDLMDPSTWEANLIEAPNGDPTFSDLAIMTLLQFDYNGKTASQYISEDIFAFITRGLAKMGLLNTDSVTPIPTPSGVTGVEKDPESVTEGVGQNGKYIFYKLFKSLYVYTVPVKSSAIFKFVEDDTAEKQNGYGVQIFNNNETMPLFVTMYKNPVTGNLAWSGFYTDSTAVPTLLRYQTGTLKDGVWSWGTKFFGSSSSNEKAWWPNNEPNWTKGSYIPYGAQESYISASTFNPDGLMANCSVSELSDTGKEHVSSWSSTHSIAEWMLNMMWNMLGASDKAEPTPGAGSQTGATQLTSSEIAALSASDTTNADAISILKGRFSNLWENRLETSTVQADGSTKTTAWLNVGVPNEIDENGNPLINQDSTDGTAGSLQQSSKINYDANQLNQTQQHETSEITAPSVLNNILKTFQAEASTQDTTSGGTADAADPAGEYKKPENVNPSPVGVGVTPGVVIPDGSAGDLFTVYRPTATELAALGSWLWSDDFIDQLKKMFSDPMQSIIGLHKVFIPPLIGGNSTIKVGYLDSGVPSDVIRQQYSAVNCGSVDLPEYFGNVFDYAPHTRVQLYLPFVGIVDLDPADVMRSTITVKYTGDAYSGACLANVYVKRDGNECCLYTFTGNDAVQYPLSSGSYMGLASAVLGVAGGIATAMVNPIYGATAMIGGVMSARTKVQHAGNLSGNAGAMGIKYPYLIITRPQTATATNFQNFVGKPANVLAQVSQCSGFTRIEGCQVSNINEATQEEKEEISKLLSSGFLA